MSHIVTWKKIADQANELHPRPVRLHQEPSNVETKAEYISGAVI